MSTPVERYSVWFVLASIAVNALIGIVAIVSGDFSDLDGKILATSLSITGASVLALGNLAARSRTALRLIPEAGAAASVVGFALLVAVIWTEFEFDSLAKSAATGILLGSGAAHASLLSLSRLADRFMVVLRLAWAMAALLVAMIGTLIWFTDATDSDLFIRLLGVVIVLLAALTIAVPVLHRASRNEVSGSRQGLPGSGGGEFSLSYCPNCGSRDLEDAGGNESRCKNCGAVFSVEFVDG